MGDARAVIDRVTQAALRGDADTLRSLYAADAVIETPDQGTINGRDAIVEWNGAFRRAFPDLAWESLHEHEVGNTAIDEGFLVGTHTGPLKSPDGQNIPATGRRMRLRLVDAATIEGGLVTSHRFYFDQLELMGQLGLEPEGPSEERPLAGGSGVGA